MLVVDQCVCQIWDPGGRARGRSQWRGYLHDSRRSSNALQPLRLLRRLRLLRLIQPFKRITSSALSQASASPRRRPVPTDTELANKTYAGISQIEAAESRYAWSLR